MGRNSEPAYTRTAKSLHWGMGVLWIVVWFIGLVCVHLRDSFNPNYQLTGVHKALASTILFFVVLRIIWRLYHPAPPLPSTMTTNMRRFAHIGHFFVYALALCALPISGWYMSSLGGKPIKVAWLFNLPPLAAPDQSMYVVFKSFHAYFAWLCGVIIAGHIFAAFHHHFVRRDQVLKNMLP